VFRVCEASLLSDGQRGRNTISQPAREGKERRHMRHDDQNAEQLRRLRAMDWAEEDEELGPIKGVMWALGLIAVLTGTVLFARFVLGWLLW
jgi:hypothetical protein